MYVVEHLETMKELLSELGLLSVPQKNKPLNVMQKSSCSNCDKFTEVIVT